MARRLMGSTYFFQKYIDFSSHDVDYVEIVKDADFLKKRCIRGQGLDLIQIAWKPTKILLQNDMDENLPMAVGKWLVPEFCGDIGFEFADLPKLKPMIDALDEKHLYEKTIYESYLKNGDFTLTEPQRLKAYNEYRESRGLPRHEAEAEC